MTNKTAHGALLVALLIPIPASANYRHLCGSVPSACSYTGPDAPVLRAEVCWNGSVATLKGSVPCPTGAWPYYVDFGDLEPLTGHVNAYVPLDLACDHPGICIAGPVPEGTASEPLCCTSGTCYPLTIDGCFDLKLLCENGVSNIDGTVTCFEGTEV